jgi:hypothetical protein
MLTNFFTVIASEAKQSRNPDAEAVWIASSLSLLAMTKHTIVRRTP